MVYVNPSTMSESKITVEQSQDDRSDGSNDPAVSFTTVGKTFNGRVALEDVSFEIPGGQFCSIVGPSGCGKTTCLHLIVGEMLPSAGGVSVLGGQPKLGRQDISYMFARDALFPWRTVISNVALALEPRHVAKNKAREMAMEMLGQVGLSEFAFLYPGQLSHGMRQRVALARTFIVKSKLLLMDEPFAALDAQTRLLLEELLVTLWEERRPTVLFVTHDLAEAVTLSDRVILLTAQPGRVKREFPIGLPRPRSAIDLQGNAKYHEIYETIWQDLRDEVPGFLGGGTR